MHTSMHFVIFNLVKSLKEVKMMLVMMIKLILLEVMVLFFLVMTLVKMMLVMMTLASTECLLFSQKLWNLRNFCCSH